jgi:hypothetical protein
MSAIITETFRKNNAKSFIDSIADVANQYYVGIGKSDSWPASGGFVEDDIDYVVAEPLGTYADNTEVLNNLTTLIGITGNTFSQVIPRIAAKPSHRHKAYNPYDPDCFYQTKREGVQMYPCYVVVSNNVYLCLKETTNSGTSFSLPSGSETIRTPFTTGDGSVWLYIYSLEAGFPIDGQQFISVPLEPTLVGAETIGSAPAAIAAATGNLVYGFTVIDGGANYTVAPTAVFVNSTTGATTALTVNLDDGAVASVTYVSPLDLDYTGWIKARGYVRLTGGNGTGAKVYPNIAPAVGFGFDPSADLPSWYAGVAVAAIEKINDDGAYIPYRQVSIVKNPDVAGGVVDATLSLNCLQYLTFGVSGAPATSSTHSPGDIITQVGTGAIGIYDYYDDVAKKLYYHQTFETGFRAFNDSEIAIDAQPYDPTGFATSEYVKQSGEVVFVENRKKITRVGGQTEEITIILQF